MLRLISIQCSQFVIVQPGTRLLTEKKIVLKEAVVLFDLRRDSRWSWTCRFYSRI
jgi:hypothetical protein